MSAVPKVVGEGPAESCRFTLQVLWESTFRVGDVMDFSWDDPRHIYPKWPHRPGLHPTLIVPRTQKNGKDQQIPMLPGLAELPQRVRGRTHGLGGESDAHRVEMESQRTGWFMPARADMEHLIATYNNSAIARACGVSETTVRKWLIKRRFRARGGRGRAAKIPPNEVAVLQARASKEAYPPRPPRRRPFEHRAGEPDYLHDRQEGQRGGPEAGRGQGEACQVRFGS